MTPLPVSVRTDSLADDPVLSEPFSGYFGNFGGEKRGCESFVDFVDGPYAREEPISGINGGSLRAREEVNRTMF
jgi:hypothetical protein